MSLLAFSLSVYYDTTPYNSLTWTQKLSGDQLSTCKQKQKSI